MPAIPESETASAPQADAEEAGVAEKRLRLSCTASATLVSSIDEKVRLNSSKMPRKPRIDAPGALHYVLLRGLEGKQIFQDEADRDSFVDRLAHLLKETSSSCYAWALMPAQIQLLLKTGKSPISSLHGSP